MEYCEKGDLDSYLQRSVSISENKIWSLFIQICLGLEYLHTRRVIHRDLKPKNIFVTKDSQIRVGDLGTAVLCKNMN